MAQYAPLYSATRLGAAFVALRWCVGGPLTPRRRGAKHRWPAIAACSAVSHRNRPHRFACARGLRAALGACRGCPFGDLTTESLGIAAEPTPIRFFAREPMRMCGVEEAVRVFQLCGAAAEPSIASGTDAAPETLLLEARGSAGALHRGCKMAQTLMEWCGGIASSAAAIVAAARRGHPGRDGRRHRPCADRARLQRRRRRRRRH